MILHFSALKDKFGQKAEIPNMMYRYFPLMLKKSAKIVFIAYGKDNFGREKIPPPRREAGSVLHFFQNIFFLLLKFFVSQNPLLVKSCQLFERVNIIIDRGRSLNDLYLSGLILRIV